MNENKLHAEVELITPELAKKYLERNTLNRPLRRHVVNFYADQIKRGQWRLNGQGISFAIGGALIDGQHRLNAVINANTPVYMLVTRNCDPDGLPTIDTGINRRISDVFSLYEIPNSTNVAAAVCKYLSFHYDFATFSAHNHISTSAKLKNTKKVTRRDCVDEYNSSSDLYQDSVRFAQRCYVKIRLYSTSEIAGLYVFLVKDKKHSTEVVEKFFNMLFFDEDVTNSTISLLREKIIKDSLSTVKMTRAYKSAITAKTWNCYVSGKELKTLSWNVKQEPKLSFL